MSSKGSLSAKELREKVLSTLASVLSWVIIWPLGLIHLISKMFRFFSSKE